VIAPPPLARHADRRWQTAVWCCLRTPRPTPRGAPTRPRVSTRRQRSWRRLASRCAAASCATPGQTADARRASARSDRLWLSVVHGVITQQQAAACQRGVVRPSRGPTPAAVQGSCCAGPPGTQRTPAPSCLCVTRQVYGISADKPAAQAKWREKEGLTFRLLCDPCKEVRAALSVCACVCARCANAPVLMRACAAAAPRMRDTPPPPPLAPHHTAPHHRRCLRWAS
jgi:hypothetical protein